MSNSAATHRAIQQQRKDWILLHPSSLQAEARSGEGSPKQGSGCAGAPAG